MRDSDRTNSGGERSLRPLPTLGLLPVLAVSVVVGGEVQAQETARNEALGTITLQAGGQGGEAANSLKVTEGSSVKLTAPLINTAKTVQVITQKEIEQRGASSVYDVLRTTPGVTLGTGEGGNPMGDRPFIRGYEASTDMMVDGVRALGRNSYEAFNLERIELVKGATGAYAGRGATGGSLNMVSKSARLGEAFNHASLSFGNASQKRAQLDSNMALSETVALRLNLYGQDGEVPGRGGIKDDKLGFAAGVTAKVSDATTVKAGMYFSSADSTPSFGIPMANDAYRDLTGDTSYGTGTAADPYRPLDYLDHSLFRGLWDRDFRKVYNRSLALGVEHEFDNGLTFEAGLTRISNQQAYIVTRPTLVDSNGDAPGGDLLFDRSSRSGHRTNVVEAFNASLKGEHELGGMTHSWVIGTEISVEKLRSGSITGIGGGSMRTPDWENPNPNDFVDMSGMSYGPLGEPVVTRSQSLYLFDTVDINEQWIANFGLRHEKFRVDQKSNGLSRKDNIWSYQAGLVYKPAANGSIYGSFSTSASPSGQCAGLAGGSEGAGACTLTASNRDLAPEKTRSFELGTKWDFFSDQLSFTAALFRTEKTNARVSDPLGVTATVGENRAQGLELGLSGQINDQWAVSAGYTYTDAKIVDGGAVNTGTRSAPVWVDGLYNGNQMHYIAKHSFSLWSTYNIDSAWTIGGGATYVGKRYTNAENSGLLPAAWRVDMMAAYQLNDKASVQLNVNNLFDEVIYDASHVGLFANVQAGRSALLKFNYEF